jgi:hypothetical protein
VTAWKDPDAPKVAIIQHPDVRRMLLDMKAKTEGVRALAVKLAMHSDRARVAGGDPAAAEYHQGQVDLLVPLLKAYSTDRAFEICATAIQVFGGAGFLKDHPVEQAARDAKIFSIYEGTNHIQALDLVGRKLSQKGGTNLRNFLGDVGAFVKANREDPQWKDAIGLLAAASETLMGTAMRFIGWSQGGKMAMVPLVANAFLDMMAETCIAWLLLEGALLAGKAAAALPDNHPDRAFYAGKQAAARWYALHVLTNVPSRAAVIGREDTTPLTIPDDAFATL